MEVQGRKFAIVGGASLIGSHIAESLLARDAAKVVLFDNLSLGSRDAVASILADPRASLVRGDVLRIDNLFDALADVDGVFSVVALLTMPLGANPGLGLDVNVRGIANLLEACRFRGIRRVVHSSSVAVYGQDPVPGFDEDRPLSWQGLQPASALYAATKTVAEVLLRLYRQKHGLEFVALRYPTVYGERQHSHGINVLQIVAIYEALRAGQSPILPDDGSEAHDYIHAADVARANVMAMESNLVDASMNIVSGVDATLNDVAALLQKLLGTNLPVAYRPSTGQARFTATPALRFSRALASKQLGWTPEVDLEEGLRRLIAWIERDRGDDLKTPRERTRVPRTPEDKR